MGDEMSGSSISFPWVTLTSFKVLLTSEKNRFVCFIYFWFYLSNICGVDSFTGNISTS